MKRRTVSVFFLSHAMHASMSCCCSLYDMLVSESNSCCTWVYYKCATYNSLTWDLAHMFQTGSSHLVAHIFKLVIYKFKMLKIIKGN